MTLVNMALTAILKAVCQHMALTRQAVLGPSRLRRHAHARHLAMALGRKLTSATHSDLARFFRRDRSSVIHGIQAHERRLYAAPCGQIANIHRDLLRSLTVQQNDALAAMQQVYHRRHREINRQAKDGGTAPEAAAQESLRLTALLRRCQDAVQGTYSQLQPQYVFEPAELAACLEAQIDRLRAAGELELAEGLAEVRALLRFDALDEPAPAPLELTSEDETE